MIGAGAKGSGSAVGSLLLLGGLLALALPCLVFGWDYSGGAAFLSGKQRDLSRKSLD